MLVITMNLRLMIPGIDFKLFILHKLIFICGILKYRSKIIIQQQVVFFFPPGWVGLKGIRTGFAGCQPGVLGFVNSLIIPLVNLMKISSTFLFVLAEHSRQVIPSFSANLIASSLFTCLSLYKSALVPTSNLTGFLVLYFSTSESQFLTSLRVFLSVRSKAKITPWAPLQQAEVMVLNFYCPAVSHICSFTLLPSCSIFLILKSTPMVVRNESEQTWSVYLRSRLDFPTEELPTRTTLKTKSYSAKDISLCV